MRRHLAIFAIYAFVILAVSPAVFAVMSPKQHVVIPEAIWAPASGGGMWVTALQITVKTAGTPVHIQFFYGTIQRTVFDFVVTSGNHHETFRFTNILHSLGLQDTAFNYYGRVGTLLIYTNSPANTIWAQAMTTNGNYGKTLPSLAWDALENSANVNRQMAIPGIQNSTKFRTFVGVWNAAPVWMTVVFHVMNPVGWSSYSSFTKTIPPYGFQAFNPFVEAGLSSSTYTNSWLYINPTACTDQGRGLFVFGSIANNISNDTYALTAIPFN